MSWVLIFYKNFNITLYVYRKQKIMVDSSDWNFSASERSNIGLMSEPCYVFFTKMWRTLHLPNKKIAQMRRVFFEELQVFYEYDKLGSICLLLNHCLCSFWSTFYLYNTSQGFFTEQQNRCYQNPNHAHVIQYMF